jgi:hypothetical protein
MTIQSPREERAKRIHKAANLSVEWQNEWAAFLKSKSTSKARAVITKGELLLQEQDELGMALKPRDHVRHRILVAQDYLDKNPTPQHTNPSTAELQKYLTDLTGSKFYKRG